MRDERVTEKSAGGLIQMKKDQSHAQPTPRHSAAVETVAREIVMWGMAAAAICTLIVMGINV